MYHPPYILCIILYSMKWNKRNIIIATFAIFILLSLIMGSLFMQKGLQTNNWEGLTNKITSQYNVQLPPENKICCLYCYYEKNEQYKNNFIYFMENGILPTVNYYIIINGEQHDVNIDRIKNRNNINIIYRKNEGYDFGAYSDVIQNYMSQKYKYYFFINTSVIGPNFTPSNIQNDGTDKDWTKPFLSLFGEDNDVKVVGTSVNICNIKNPTIVELYGDKPVYSHVQSMFFCIDDVYFNYLKNDIDFFNKTQIYENIQDVIIRKELGLSQYAINNGWNINCILSKYRGLDYRTVDKNINFSSNEIGDPYFVGAYFGNTIEPYEVIFFKNSRFL